MIELATAIAFCVASLGFGLCLGMLLHYYVEHKPLRDSYEKLVDTMTHMKRQGFVPQFEIENPKEYDPSEGIIES